MAMIDRLGHALGAWLVPVNFWTAVLLGCALLVDRALARRTRASMRIALYAPVALRVLLPLSWAMPGAYVPRMAVLMPLQALSASDTRAGAPGSACYSALAALYLGVAFCLALRGVVKRWQLARALDSARPLDFRDAPCPTLCHDELGPMVVGLVRARIVLPQALVREGSAYALGCITRHEAAHVRRGDPWLAVGLELLLAAAWPVLPLWIAAARVRHLVELACDEEALANADATERRRYGHLLLDLAEQRPLAFAGVGSLHFGSKLRARIEAIALQRPWPRALQLGLITATVAGFAACSSAAPSTVPQAVGTTQAAAAAGSADEYGYRYEEDRLHAASEAPASPTKDSDNPGRLPPEIIQGVVRQSFGRFRTCYEAALKRNPALRGTATVSFVIAPNGSVQNAKDDHSTLPDADAVQCIVKGFGALSFPPPKDGYVTVVYPVEFSPGD
jgi:hypothetical protein